MRHLLAISLCLAACGGGFTDPERELGPAVAADAKLHAVEIHQPRTLGVADTPLVDVHGTRIGVRCATCHGPTPEVAWTAAPGAPDTLHEAVEVEHGTLECDYCHDAEDRTKLHLANGELLDMEDAMRLCAQCHGVQVRDYNMGSHGGMNGYWDRRRGPRVRNHCVDCHAPHAPAYGQVLPVHPPRDRYLAVDGEH